MIRELTIEDWRDEIARGLDERKEHGAEAYWAEIEALFYGQHESSASAGPNLILATGDALMSALTVPEPVYSVKALTPDDLEKAKVVQSILNGLLVDLNIRQEVEHMVLSAFLYGVGIGKVGFDSQYGFAPDRDIGGDLQPMNMTLTQFDRRGRMIEFGGAMPGEPWFQSVLPHDFVVPYGTHRLSQARWAAHRVVRHIEEVKADAKYEHTRDLQPTMTLEDYRASYLRPAALQIRHTGRTTSSSQRKSRCEYVELWEIHDRQTGKVIVFAEGHNKFLRKDIDPLQIDGQLPFVDLAFMPRARSFWTTPDALYLLPHQAELTDIHIQADKTRRTSVPKVIASSDAFEDDQLEKMTRADVNPIIFVRSGVPIDQAVKPFPQPNNYSLYNDAEFVRRASREMVGLSANQFGEFDRSTRRSATEANIVAASANQRLDRKQYAIRDTYIQIGQKLQQVVFSYWDDVRVTPYIGQDGAMQWARYQGTALRGRYRCKVSFHSEQTPAPAQQKEVAVGRAMLMAQLGIPAERIIRYLVEQMDDPLLSQMVAEVMGNGQPQPAVGGPGGMGAVGTGPMAMGAAPVQAPPPGPEQAV